MTGEPLDSASLPLLAVWLRQAFGVAPAPADLAACAAMVRAAFERYLSGQPPEQFVADPALRPFWEWLAAQPQASAMVAAAHEEFVDLLDDL